MTQPPPREFSDEEIRQIEAEMDKLQVEDVLLQTLVTLINLGARKAGLAAPPGEEPAARDLGQTKQAIDGARALFGLLEAEHGDQLAPIKDALSRLQMAYVQLSGGTPSAAVPETAAEPKKPEGPGAGQSSSRLWVPGQ